MRNARRFFVCFFYYLVSVVLHVLHGNGRSTISTFATDETQSLQEHVRCWWPLDMPFHSVVFTQQANRHRLGRWIPLERWTRPRFTCVSPIVRPAMECCRITHARGTDPIQKCLCRDNETIRNSIRFHDATVDEAPRQMVLDHFTNRFNYIDLNKCF